MSTATEAQEKKGGSDVKPFDFATGTLEQFEDQIDNNPEFRDDYSKNMTDPKYERFHEMIGAKLSGVDIANPQGAQKDQEKQPANPQGETVAPATEQDLTVSLKIPKDLLGSYLVNRTPEEAVIEVIKGKNEADKYIEKLRSKTSALSDETISLRNQLTQALERVNAAPQEQAAAAQAAGPQAEQNAQEVNLDELESLDLFDPDNHKKVTGAIRSLATQLAEIRKGKPTEQPSGQKTTPEIEKARNDNVNELLEREFDEIEELQMKVPELRTPKAFKDLDQDVLNFYTRIDEIAGAKNYLDGVRRYFSQTPEGQALRDQCAEQKVAPPEGYQAHQQIMTYRTKRNEDKGRYLKNLSQKLGQDISEADIPPIPHTSYIDYYNLAHYADIRKIGLESRIEGHREAQAASAAAKNHVPDIPPEKGQPETSVTGWTMEQKIALLNKPSNSYTQEEARLATEIYKEAGEKPPHRILKKANL